MRINVIVATELAGGGNHERQLVSVVELGDIIREKQLLIGKGLGVPMTRIIEYEHAPIKGIDQIFSGGRELPTGSGNFLRIGKQIDFLKAGTWFIQVHSDGGSIGVEYMQISVTIRFWEIIISGKSKQILPIPSIGGVFIAVNLVQSYARLGSRLCRNTSYPYIYPVRRAKNTFPIVHVSKIIVGTVTISPMNRFTTLVGNHIISKAPFNIFSIEGSVTKQQKVFGQLLVVNQRSIP